MSLGLRVQILLKMLALDPTSNSVVWVMRADCLEVLSYGVLQVIPA